MLYEDTYICFLKLWREVGEVFTQNSVLVTSGENVIGVGGGGAVEGENRVLYGTGDIPLLELGCELTHEHFVIP